MLLSLNWWETQHLAVTGLDHTVPGLGEQELRGEARILFGATGFARTFPPLTLDAETRLSFGSSATVATERPVVIPEVIVEPSVVHGSATLLFGSTSEIHVEWPRTVGGAQALRVFTQASIQSFPPLRVDSTFTLETHTEANVSTFAPIVPEPVIEIEPEAFDSNDIILIAALWMEATNA